MRLTPALFTTALGLFLSLPPAEASPILRAAFDVGATTYDLTGASFNAVTASNGDATLSNGAVANTTLGAMVSPTFYDGGDASVIRIDFMNPVSAFGLDWFANNSNPTLSVFDSGNTLLESLTLNWLSFPILYGFPTGFIGLNVGSNTIAYATIDTPLNGDELYVDNLIYQRAAAVPGPATLPLLAIGAAGLATIRRRKAA